MKLVELHVCGLKLLVFIIWQGKYERSDWFFFGRDHTIRTVSTETVQAVYFFVSKAGKFICSLNC